MSELHCQHPPIQHAEFHCEQACLCPLRGARRKGRGTDVPLCPLMWSGGWDQVWAGLANPLQVLGTRTDRIRYIQISQYIYRSLQRSLRVGNPRIACASFAPEGTERD
jgi:hypothetical protein